MLGIKGKVNKPFLCDAWGVGGVSFGLNMRDVIYEWSQINLLSWVQKSAFFTMHKAKESLMSLEPSAGYCTNVSSDLRSIQ